MRPRLIGILGTLAVASLLAAPVALADPGQSSWESNSITGVPDLCTGELVDLTIDAHFVNTDAAPFHFNVHIVGVGETTGSTYVGENVVNDIFQALPDGTFLMDHIANVRLVGQGGLSNSWITVREHLIVDSNGNVISGRTDSVSGCQGG